MRGWAPLDGTQTDYLTLMGGLPEQWRLTWDQEGVRTTAWGFSPAGTTAALTECPGVTVGERQHLVVRSSTATTTWFLTVLDVGTAGAPGVEAVALHPEAQGVRIHVTTPSGTDQVTLVAVDGDAPSLDANGATIRVALGGDLPAQLTMLTDGASSTAG